MRDAAKDAITPADPSSSFDIPEFRGPIWIGPTDPTRAEPDAAPSPDVVAAQAELEAIIADQWYNMSPSLPDRLRAIFRTRLETSE